MVNPLGLGKSTCFKGFTPFDKAYSWLACNFAGVILVPSANTPS